MRRRRPLLIVVALAFLLLIALAVRWGQALTLATALAAPSADVWLGTVLPHIEREGITLGVGSQPLHADCYRPPRPRSGIVLVHGLSRAGRRHPELVRFARLLAQHDRLVLVPEFDGLVAFRLGRNEIEEIKAAVRYLTTLTDSLGIIGFSFGAGPALLAAADLPGVRLVGSFGGYADLRHVVAYITTGVHTYRGERHVQRQEEYNRWKLLAVLVGFVEDDHDMRRLAAVAERKLADPGGDTKADLGAHGRAVLDLVTNRREDLVPALLAGLPMSARQALDRLSPLRVIDRVSGRLLIAHGMADDSIPFTESLRLADAAGGRAHLAILRTFHHTGTEPLWRSFTDRARDAWSVVHLADQLLAASRGDH